MSEDTVPSNLFTMKGLNDLENALKGDDKSITSMQDNKCAEILYEPRMRETESQFLQRELMSDMQTTFGAMGKDLITSKLAQTKLLEESASHGGPSSVSEALLTMMRFSKVGVRELSVITKIKRKRLQDMLDGKVTMPPEVFDELLEIFIKRSPKMFSKEGNPLIE